MRRGHLDGDEPTGPVRTLLLFRTFEELNDITASICGASPGVGSGQIGTLGGRIPASMVSGSAPKTEPLIGSGISSFPPQEEDDSS